VTIYFLYGKVLGIEAVPKPVTKGIVLWMRRIVHGIKKVSKARGTATMLGRTTPGSRHARPLKRIVSIEDLFQQEFVLPAVAKVILV
jgi:hypothetical protein